MLSPLSQDYSWSSLDAANGESGECLADSLITLIKALDGVQTVCDLGCGNGYLAGRLSELGYYVTGIDASTSGIELAGTKYPKVRFLCALIDEHLSAINK